MNKTSRTKKFFTEYQKAMAHSEITGEKIDKVFLSQFISDAKLIEHILFFKKAFPNYKMIVKDIIVDEEKVFVRTNFMGKHTGEVDGIAPTFKDVNIPFAMVYTIKNDKIVDFSAIANEMEFLEQLGLTIKQINMPWPD